MSFRDLVDLAGERLGGSVLAQAGKTEDALADFNKAISLDPNYGQAFANRGQIYRKTKRLDQAMSDYERALAWAYDGIARQGRRRHSLDGGSADRARRVFIFAGSALLPGAGDGSAEVSVGLMAAKLRSR